MRCLQRNKYCSHQYDGILLYDSRRFSTTCLDQISTDSRRSRCGRKASINVEVALVRVPQGTLRKWETQCHLNNGNENDGHTEGTPFKIKYSLKQVRYWWESARAYCLLDKPSVLPGPVTLSSHVISLFGHFTVTWDPLIRNDRRECAV